MNKSKNILNKETQILFNQLSPFKTLPLHGSKNGKKAKLFFSCTKSKTEIKENINNNSGTTTDIDEWEKEAKLVTVFSGLGHGGKLNAEFKQLADTIVTGGYGISYGCSTGRSQKHFLDSAIAKHRTLTGGNKLKVKCVGHSGTKYDIYNDKFNKTKPGEIVKLKDYSNGQGFTIYKDNDHKRTVELIKMLP